MEETASALTDFRGMEELVTLLTRYGQPFEMTIRHHRPSIYVLACHKSGSTLLQNVIDDLLLEAPVPACNFESQLFQQGIGDEDVKRDIRRFLGQPGVLFYVFRSCKLLSRVDHFHEAKRIALVRDPRDIVVSYYFSIVLSHPVPPGEIGKAFLVSRTAYSEMSVDEFADGGHADFVLDNMRDIVGQLKTDSGDVLFRYEDIIYKKRKWVEHLAEELGLSVSRKKIHHIAERHDLVPAVEAPTSHIRQVHPGNHQRYLSSSTVARIERDYADLFESLGYPCST